MGSILDRRTVKFLAVGAAGVVVDAGVFNLLRGLGDTPQMNVIAARILAVAAAMAVTYAGNRYWTWRNEPKRGRAREVALFLGCNAIALGLSVSVLAISHYGLGLQSALADNIAVNVVGLGLGTAFRFLAYDRIVFTDRSPLTPAPIRGWARALPVGLLAIATVAALARVPFTGAPMSPDEGGFLVVARGWLETGDSLYGPYWVDRPPLLVELFRAGDAMGGLVGLRVLGCLAVFGATLGVGLAVRAVAGNAPALWGAGVTGALLAAPGFGTLAVNGEILAAPFIAMGVALIVLAVARAGARGALVPAVAAGACGAAALMVKQNMIDVAVVAGAMLPLAAASGLVTWRRAGRIAALASAGAFATIAIVIGAAAVRGTNPGDLLYALYPFRVDASDTLSDGWTDRLERAEGLASKWVESGAALLPLLAALVLVIWHRRGPEQRSTLKFSLGVAGLALTVYAVISIGAGGNYWPHYLIQLAVPTGLLAGVLVTSLRVVGAIAGGIVLATSFVGWASAHIDTNYEPGHAVGSSLDRVAKPSDTAVSALGDPAILAEAHLSSPYQHLWSLPSRTLDPNLAELRRLMSGSRAPTWFVVRGNDTHRLLMRKGIARILDERYRRVSEICGRPIYLQRGVDRRRPSAFDCSAPVSNWGRP